MRRKAKVCEPADKVEDEQAKERKEIRDRLSNVEALVKELSADLEEVKEKLDKDD